jgi:carboxymethylenebutenolidase
MPLSVARTDSPRGAVIVIQEAFGVNDHIEDVCARFAAAGWFAVAPAIYHRAGSPVVAYDDFAGIRPAFESVTGAGLAIDLDATTAYLATQGFTEERVAIVGFCMGGTVAFFEACRRPLGAAVTFYGGGIASGRFGLPSQIDLAPSLETPWLGLYGDRDQSIPVDEVEALRAAAAQADVPTEVVRYTHAEHGFHCDQRPANYNAEAAADGWARTLAWFAQHVPAA